MKLNVSNAKLGLFIITGTTLLVVLLVMFGSGVFSRKGLIVETYIDDSVHGLDVGSPLNFRGVRIGRIRDIGLVENFYPNAAPEHSRIVLIRMEIRPPHRGASGADLTSRIEQWVEEGMRVRHTTQGLTGVGFMEANFVRPDSHPPLQISWEPLVPYIPSAPTQLTRLANSIEAIAQDFEQANIPQIAGNIERLLLRLDSTIEEAGVSDVSHQLRDSLTRVERIMGNIEEITSDPATMQISAKATATLDQLDATMEEVREKADRISEELMGALTETRGAMADARGQLGELELRESFQRLGELTERIDMMLARTEESFARKDDQVDLILLDLRAMSSNMRDLTQLLSQYPSLAVFGQPPPQSEVYRNE